MGKRGVLLLLFLVVCSSLVYATHDATLTLEPTEVYETVEQEFNLSINNFKSQDSIIDVKLELTSLQVQDVTEFSDWQNDFTADSIHWFDGSVETNVISALFQFYASSTNVDEDQNVSLTITTEDSEGNTEEQTLYINLINDETGPILTNADPSEDSYIKEGATETVSVNAEDPETDVKKVSFSYAKCANNLTLVQLQKQNGSLYSKDVNFTTYVEGDFVCYEYNAESNGGEETTLSGQFAVDGTAPVVTLISPEDNAKMNNDSVFVFNVTDTLSPRMNCELLIDNDVEAEVVADNNEETSIPTTGISEGVHDWKIGCEDLAGNAAVSEERSYTLDRSPPEIIFFADEQVYRGNDIEVEAEITDLSGVDKVTAEIENPDGNETSLTVEKVGDTYTVSYSTDIDTEMGIYTVRFYAKDNVGYETEKEIEILLTYGYIVSLNLNPSSTTPGHNVVASGNVKFDNGSLIPEDEIDLVLPSGEITVDLDSNGDYTHTFKAPNSVNDYTITAKVTAENDVTYRKDAILTVRNANNNNQNSGSGSSGFNDGYTAPEHITVTYGSDTEYKIVDKEDENQEQEEENTFVDEEEEVQEEETEGTPGIGKASGFFNLDNLKKSKLLWAILVLAIIAGSLYYMSKDGEKPLLQKSFMTKIKENFKAKKPEKPTVDTGKLNLDDYLQNRLGKK